VTDRWSRPTHRAELLKSLAAEEGFELAGIVAPDPSGHVDFLERWVGEERHGTMEYLARPEALSRRGDLRSSLPDVRSVLVVAHGYGQEDSEGIPEDPALGVIARYARGRDYHRVMRKKLQRIHRRFAEALGEAVPARAFVDTGPLLERELAQRAGMGWFGRNTMLIHPRCGSWFFLGALLLATDLDADPPFERDHCGSCRACLDACPTGALLGRDPAGAPVMDARRCISYLTIENRGPIPVELRSRIGNRIYGCDICQEVCPFNERFGETGAEPGYAARGPGERPVGVEPLAAPGISCEAWPESSDGALHPGTDAPSLIALLEMALDLDAWEAFSRGSAIRRAGRAGFARNVCISLGNWGSPEALPVLARALADPEWLVRGHAAWALGRVGGEAASDMLSAASSSEEDAWVVVELEAARSSASGRSRGEVGEGAR